MKWITVAVLAAAGTLTACSAADGAAQSSGSEPLLASELIYEEVTDKKDLSFKIDPWLAKHPEIAREVNKQKRFALAQEECQPDQTCTVSSNVEMQHSGERLVSLIDTTTSFYGGAHPSMKAADMTFDVKAGRMIRFGDIFNSWPAARELLQRQWCNAVSQHTSCPPIEEQALALSEGYIFVQTSDYAFGSYAEGSDKAYLPITPELIALAKPEYQSSFSLEVCC